MVYSDSGKNEFFLGIIKSFSAHIVVIILAVISTIVISTDKSNNEVSNVEIIKSSVRVDVVGMPKYTIQELKKMTMEDFNQNPTEEVVKEDQKEEVGGSDKVEFKKEAPKIDVGNLLAGFSNRKIEVKKANTTKKNLNIDTSKLKKLVLEGNKVSEGNALVGDTQDSFDIGAFSKYANNLPNHIRPFWKLPSYLLQQNFKCRIRIFIAEDGKIIRAEVFESSGNSEYDQKALSSVVNVKQFPAPKSEFAREVANGSIVLGFPL